VAIQLTYIRNKAGRRTKVLTIVLWIVQMATASAFFVAGAAQLYSISDAVGLSSRVGFGQWFRYVTGAIEFGSAVLLLYPGLAAIGAFLLACTMTAAIAGHVVVIGGSSLPAAILLGCCLFIAWGRQDDSVSFRRRARRAH
jgi:putative oxidoreductase